MKRVGRRRTPAHILIYPKYGTSQEKCSLIEHQIMGPNWTHAEGFILGVGAKMFTIAGPVIVYGVSASVVYGLIYWVCQMLI